MIEVVSYPEDLAKWNQDMQPFYLELFGETSPLIGMKDTNAPSSVPNTTVPNKDEAKSTTVLPIYEYNWTLGLRGLPNPKYRHHSPDITAVPQKGLASQMGSHFYKSAASVRGGAEPGASVPQGDSPSDPFWEDLQDVAAEVYLLFPINGGWRIQEIVATVKYLIPAPPQHAWLADIDHVWQAVQPVVSDVGNLTQTAGKLTGQPELDAAGSMLSAIAKARINSVPPTAGYTWSVNKETFFSKSEGVLEGLRWTLPKQLFTELGGRLTGSVAVSFIQARVQKQGATQADESTSQQPPSKEQFIRAYAAIYGSNGPKKPPNPGATPLIKLQVKPI